MAQRPGGVVILRNLNGSTTELHSSKCAHCQHQTTFPTKRSMTDHIDICRGCMRMICLGCVGKPCKTELARCEEIERKHHRARMWADLKL